MRYIITTIILIVCGTNVSAQDSIPQFMIDRIEKLLLHHEIEVADSLLRLKQLDFGSTHTSYQEDYLAGLMLYQQMNYEKSISLMSASVVKMDEMRLWNCEDYLKTAFYIADSYFRIGKLKESEDFINYALVKCVDSYSSCIYAKKIYQTLLAIYKENNCSPSIIEQVHNEIQKIAINIYSSSNTNRDGEQIRENFMFFYDYITKPPISKEDSLIMDLGKANNMHAIYEYEEAIRLFEKVKAKLSKNDQQLKGINESLLIDYSATAQTGAIENLLKEMYDYSAQMNLDYDKYILNVWVGHNLNQNYYYDLAQYYYERCDSFLNTNRNLPEWNEKKKNVLSKMILNCNSLGAYENVISYCREYSEISKKGDFAEQVFVNYNQAYAYAANENYEDAISILRNLISYIQLNNGVNNKDYIMANAMLGVCYDKTNNVNKSFDCASTAIDIYKKMKIDDKSLQETLYNNIGNAYLRKGKYKKAISLLNLAAEIQIELTGKVYKITQEHINECKRKEK